MIDHLYQLDDATIKELSKLKRNYEKADEFFFRLLSV